MVKAMGWLQRFFSFVEIKTKVASLLPFLLGLVYVAYQGYRPNWGLSLLFLLAMTFFDMSTTALNNFIDTRASGISLPLPRPLALIFLLAMLLIASGSGLVLAWLSNPVVFWAGAASFFVGIAYTFGPAPISRMPLGELFSGFFMGFFIPFITVTINSSSLAPVQMSWQAPELFMTINLLLLLHLFVLAILPITTIAAIMLANNICDLERDIKINRFTLPFYLGKKRSLVLFALLYLAALLSLVVSVLLGLLPPLALFSLLAAWPLQKNIRRFFALQDKAETFPLSVQNFILLVLPPVLITALVTASGL